MTKRNGFTIIELLIAIVVVAILASISVVAYKGIQDRARYSLAQDTITQLTKALEIYYLQHGEYPNSHLCAGSPGEYNYQHRWCGWDQGTNDSFIPGLKEVAGSVPNLPKSLPQRDTLLYQSRGPDGGDDYGTAQYQILRFRGDGLSDAEKENNPKLITVSGYDGYGWGVKSNPESEWW